MLHTLVLIVHTSCISLLSCLLKDAMLLGSMVLPVTSTKFCKHITTNHIKVVMFTSNVVISNAAGTTSDMLQKKLKSVILFLL